MGMLDGLMGMLSGNGSAASTTIGPGTMSSMSPDQWGTAVQNPNTGGGVGAMFSDPNFISFLAGTGAALDPNGVGGAVGNATQKMVQNQQMGKAMAKQDQRWSALIEAMGKGQVGKASISEDSKTGKTSVSLSAPENGGGLSQPSGMAQPGDFATVEQPNYFAQYLQPLQDWASKYGLGGK